MYEDEDKGHQATGAEGASDDNDAFPWEPWIYFVGFFVVLAMGALLLD
jgi:Ni/Fe-hydrogenase subunit HybB-like protein